MKGTPLVQGSTRNLRRSLVSVRSSSQEPQVGIRPALMAIAPMTIHIYIYKRVYVYAYMCNISEYMHMHMSMYMYMQI